MQIIEIEEKEEVEACTAYETTTKTSIQTE